MIKKPILAKLVAEQNPTIAPLAYHPKWIAYVKQLNSFTEANGLGTFEYDPEERVFRGQWEKDRNHLNGIGHLAIHRFVQFSVDLPITEEIDRLLREKADWDTAALRVLYAHDIAMAQGEAAEEAARLRRGGQ